MPRDVWSTFPGELQLLYRHVAEGVQDWLQPEVSLSHTHTHTHTRAR
eukprot:COSAG03_NODE_380_length_8364_cov_20.212099_1_plen_46_part_10